MLELLRDRPNWLGALSVALTRPPGVPERRHGEDPWQPGATNRPRRITDDLAWLRRAIDDPDAAGFRPVPRHGAVGAWDHDDGVAARLRRLRDRHVLAAAGFELTDGPPGRRRTTPPRFERSAGRLDSAGRPE